MTLLGNLNKNSMVYASGDLNDATQSTSGLMSSTDKTKLDGIASGAQVNTIESIKVNNVEQSITNKSVNIAVPTQASQVGALPDSTKYGAGLSLELNQSDYKVTIQLKDQNGNNLGDSRTIDLPLESMVVSAEYLTSTKEIQLTLQNGTTVKFSVADLVSGLQTELSSSNKLNPDFINTDSTHRFVSDSEKSTWSGKQNAITDGSATIATVSNNIVTLKAGVSQSNGAVTQSSGSDITLSKVAKTGSYNDLTNKPTLGSLSSKNSIEVTDLDNSLQVQFADIQAKNDAISNIISEFGISSSLDVEELDTSTLASIVKELCLALVAQSSN